MSHLPNRSDNQAFATFRQVEAFLLSMGKNPYEDMNDGSPLSSLSLSGTIDSPKHFLPIDTFKDIKVLLIDDNEINQQLVTRILGDQLIEVFAAKEASRVFEHLATKPCDLIIMSMQVPRISTASLVREIRRVHKGEFEHIPILAFTAANISEEEIAQLGLDGKIGKPIDKDELISVFLQVLFE